MPHPYLEKTKSSFIRFRDKISRLNHYPRSGLVVSGISFGLIILLYCFGLPGELIFTNNIEVGHIVLTFFSTTALIAHLFSNATYIAGTIDLFNEPKPEIKNKTTFERWSTLLGILIGLSVGIAFACSLPLDFFSFLSTVTVTTGASAGLGSRLGGLTRRPFLLEQIFLGLSFVGGIVMGSSLVLTGTTPFLHVTGVISFLTGGPPLIASIVFVCFVTSLCMSGADYLSKALVYAPELPRRIYNWLYGLPAPANRRHHEYEGSFFGALLSLMAIAFFVTHLHLLASAVLAHEGYKLGLAITATLVAKCFGVDGIFSRVGRTLDNLFEEDDTLLDKAGKTVLVITGVAGLMVIWDMGNKMIHYLYCKKTPDLSPIKSPLISGSNNFIDTRLHSDEAIEVKNSNPSLPSRPLTPLVIAPSPPRLTPPNSLSPLSPAPSSSQERSPAASSTHLSSESDTRSPSTSWWKKFSFSDLWTSLFYTPTPRGTNKHSHLEHLSPSRLRKRHVL